MKTILSAGLIIFGFLPAMGQGYKFFDPQDSLSIPKSISASGLYLDIPGKHLDPMAVPFDVNVALWSDGSAKQRWILLKPGTKIAYNDTGDFYKYPDGTVFVKNFSIDTIPGDSLSRILWETRLLVLKLVVGKEKWLGFSYHWNPQQTDAYLVAKEGMNSTLRIRPAGKNTTVALKKWRFPSRNECNTCHLTLVRGTVQGRSVLGFFTAQLNRASLHDRSLNQLQHFFNLGIFQGASPSDFRLSPKWARQDDGSASLETRARSYIGANCSGCHGSRGLVVGGAWGVDLNYDFHDMKPKMEWVGRETSRTLGIEGVKLITPTRPDLSLLYLRQTFRDTAGESFQGHPDQMPPLGTFQEDTVATGILSAWIKGMPPSGITGRRRARETATMPFFQNGFILIPEPFTVPRVDAVSAVSLVDALGNRVGLQPSGAGRFRIMAFYSPGLHWVTYQGRPFPLVLF
ncbi:MAG: hypothetical protein M3Y08_09830 [Fibrobacterota bacterium]|nr:hypothetical protein [Fibrobacterota bacterium]